MGCHSLLQGIIPTQGSNLGFCMQADSLPAEPPGNLIIPLFAMFTLSVFYFIFFSMFRLVALFSNLVISCKLLPSLAFSLKACALYVPWCLRLFFFLALTCNMQNLSSLTRNWTCAPCGGSIESQPLDHQGSPSLTEFPNWEIICVHHNALLLIIHNLQTSLRIRTFSW